MAGNAGWEAFAETVALGSFAWAGEDEAFSVKRGFRDADRINVEVDATAVDIALLTGIAAPEPPALVLAGLAFGGVLCGRSLVMRRRKAVGETISESETPLA